ncbi:hypothetical protein JCM8208_000037 [Rhodotorula glutinis]
MLAASTSYPFFDPADFASSSPSPSTVSPASSTSSVSSQRWVDAHTSPYSSCGHLAAKASSSQTSLWTASTTSDDEQRCLDLLDQLEDEVSKLGDRTSPVKPTRSAPLAREQTNATAGPSSSRMVARAVVASSSTSTLRPSHPRRSRRLSFTKTDLADLDIDAILEAYSHDGSLPPIETAAPPVRPARSQLRAAKSAVSLRTLRTDIFPTERAFPRPPQVTAQNLELHRTATDQSARSAHSASSGATTAAAAYDGLFPQRRVAPFPTMERKKSSTSMRSMATRRPSAADAPPLPPMPAAHFSSSSEHGSPAPSIRSNRTFSSFARQSTCSNTSSLASFASGSSSSPNPSSSAAARSHAMRSTLSRDSHYSTMTSSSAASSSEANSFRWSVATSSTAPSDTDTASSSRRGSSGPPLPAGAAALASPPHGARSGKGRRFAAPCEDDEDDFERELDADLPASRRRAALGAPRPSAHDDDSDAERDHGGLISWEDFASELEALAPPPAAAPSLARRAGALPVQQQQQQYAQVPSTASLKAGREGGRASRMRKISLATLRAR